MYLALTARIQLDADDEPSSGVVTWFDADVMEILEDESELKLGEASAALIHAGDRDEDLLFALDADSGELEAMYHVYFDKNGDLRDQFVQGTGLNVLYVAGIELGDEHRSRNIDLAVLRRLADALGDGCELVVIPYESKSEAEHWQRMGFQVSTPGAETGYVHLPLAFRQARVVPDGDGFKVLPDPYDAGKGH